MNDASAVVRYGTFSFELPKGQSVIAGEEAVADRRQQDGETDLPGARRREGGLQLVRIHFGNDIPEHDQRGREKPGARDRSDPRESAVTLLRALGRRLGGRRGAEIGWHIVHRRLAGGIRLEPARGGRRAIASMRSQPQAPDFRHDLRAFAVFMNRL